MAPHTETDWRELFGGKWISGGVFEVCVSVGVEETDEIVEVEAVEMDEVDWGVLWINCFVAISSDVCVLGKSRAVLWLSFEADDVVAIFNFDVFISKLSEVEEEEVFKTEAIECGVIVAVEEVVVAVVAGRLIVLWGWGWGTVPLAEGPKWSDRESGKLWGARKMKLNAMIREEEMRNEIWDKMQWSKESEERKAGEWNRSKWRNKVMWDEWER